MTQQIAYTIGNCRYVSINDRCTLECTFCPKTQGSMRVHEFDLTMNHRPDAQEIIDAIGAPEQYDEVVFCGFGEPTLRLNVLLEVARAVKDRGARVRVNTDGLSNLVHKDNTLPALGECVDAFSVSMNAQNKAVYDLHCCPNLPGSYEAMLDFLKAAPRFVSEVTATAIDGLEGVDIEACETLARELGVNFRRRVLDRVG